MKLKISKEDKILDNADKGFMVSVEIPEGMSYEDINKLYNKKRFLFVDRCRDKNISYEEIGRWMGITKQAVYVIHKYGSNKFTSTFIRNMKNRKGKICRLCGIKRQKGLHLHHIDGNGLNNKERNLIVLCPKCHNDLHQFMRKTGKKLSTFRKLTKVNGREYNG